MWKDDFHAVGLLLESVAAQLEHERAPMHERASTALIAIVACGASLRVDATRLLHQLGVDTSNGSQLN
jgi:hypothetical protein